MNALNSPTVSRRFGLRWQNPRLRAATPLWIRLAPFLHDITPYGVHIASGSTATPVVFKRCVIRNNLIRKAFPTVPDDFSRGVVLDSCGMALVDPLRHQSSSIVDYFNSTTSAGVLISGAEIINQTTLRKVPEVADTIEDAILVSL